MVKQSVLLALMLLPGLSHGLVADELKTPMASTVKLIQGLEQNIRRDGKNEQESFDKYACWCEKTMERKAADISSGKDVIAETQTLIKKLKGEIASHGAEVAALKKDIADNHGAQVDAEELRAKENGEYAGERTESEQCIGALEAAIKVLAGAGTKSFLQGDGHLHEAELLSVIAGVRRALDHKIISATLSNTDIDTMRHFVSKPTDFVGKGTKAMSAAQVGQNPFGDYAPQSTQITGILQGMYDAMTADLEKDNANEADSQKAFEELMATKKEEKETLESTLQKQETDHAAKDKKLSESEVLLEDTSTDVDNDEQFFGETKEACQVKASQWSVRTRLRTEELNGMVTAIKILSSSDAKKTFGKSTTTFLQLASVHRQTQRSSSAQAQNNAYTQLKALATRFRSRTVAQIAVAVQAGGHFDKVIAMIDEMTVVLRKEEQDDIEHRDRCENDQNANANQRADLQADIEKTKKSIVRMNNAKNGLVKDIAALDEEIKATEKDMADLLEFRNQEEAKFKQALEDDTDAVRLLKKATAALSAYYTNNKIAMPELLQKGPKYAEDKDDAPETSFAGSDSRNSETGGILAILEMLVEDSEKEIAEGHADNVEAKEKYSKLNGALQETLDGQNDAKASAETQKADLEEKMRTYGKHKDERSNDLDAEDDTQGSLATDCAWVKSHFGKRRENRKTEMQGLVDAKGFLAGVAAGQDPLPPTRF